MSSPSRFSTNYRHQRTSELMLLWNERYPPGNWHIHQKWHFEDAWRVTVFSKSQAVKTSDFSPRFLGQTGRTDTQRYTNWGRQRANPKIQSPQGRRKRRTGGGFKLVIYVYFHDFHPYLGRWSNLTSIFFKWVEMKPPTRKRRTGDGKCPVKNVEQRTGHCKVWFLVWSRVRKSMQIL